MDLIRTDPYGKELGYIQKADVDFEVSEGDAGSINTFVIEFRREDWNDEIKDGCRVFSPRTEFGGIYKELNTDTSIDMISIGGYTWRGMLCRKIIRPASGQDYAYASGELNQIIKEKVEGEFPGLFYGVERSTGATINHYQFNRYCDLHSGLQSMLETVGHKLKIQYVQGDYGESGYVTVEAVPIMDYSDEFELSQDNNMNFTMKDKRNGVNHLICLGKGELRDRLVIDLYVDRNGNISNTQHYFGQDEIAEVYDSSGSEAGDLLENGKKKLNEIKNSTEYNMTLQDLNERDIDIGDIAGGRDYITGAVVKKPIGRKIWTISNGKEKIEFKLRGDM